MRRLWPFIIIAVIVLALESGGLWALNGMVGQDAQFSSVSLPPPIPTSTWELPVEVAPRSVRLSADGRYIAYPGGERLVVVDLTNHRVLKVLPLAGQEVTALCWLPDRPRLFYASAPAKEASGNLRIYSFDAQTGENRFLHDIVSRTKESRVTAISLSSFTNLAYFKVEDAPISTRLYRLDVMGDLYRARFRIRIGQIAVLPHQDRIMVEDAEAGVVWSVTGVLGTDRRSVASPADQTQQILLGVSSDDRIFVGDLSMDTRRVVGVETGEAGQPMKVAWHEDGGIPRDHLALGIDGTLYDIEPQAHTITELTGRRRTLRYRGEMLSFDGRLLASLQDGRLRVEPARF